MQQRNNKSRNRREINMREGEGGEELKLKNIVPWIGKRREREG